METSDDELVIAVQGGEKDCFAVLVERYDTVIYNLMYRYSNSPEEAADMTREVFCRAYEKLGRYRNRTSFFAWLYTLALNYARDWKKKQLYRRIKLSRYAEELKTENTVFDYKPEKKQESERLMEALKSLPEDRSELLILRYRHDRSIRELADIFTISESAVKMRIKRTLEDLKGLLG